MLKDITLGQYFPRNTLIHRLDPRTKLVMTGVYIGAVFTAKNYISYGVVLIFLLAVIWISKAGLRLIFKSLKPLIIIISITAFLNMFFTGGTPIIRFWIFTLTREGVENAVFMTLRIVLLVAGTFLLTYSTSPLALTDGLEMLFGPLKKLKVPVHELAMMMSTALRFIPTLIEEMEKIMRAQKARGADFETGNLFQRAKALLPILVPLFVSAFKRADDLAIAMESRCYRGGEGRTRMKKLVLDRRDFFTFAIGAIFLAFIIVLAVLGL